MISELQDLECVQKPNEGPDPVSPSSSFHGSEMLQLGLEREGVIKKKKKSEAREEEEERTRHQHFHLSA